MSETEGNKAAAVAFLDLAFNQGLPEEAAAKYLGATYKQHNPAAADGAESFIAFSKEMAAQFPELRIDVKRVVGEGDFVVIHAHALQVPGDRGFAAMDIFRFQDGKIIEHWDVAQPVPETSANSNGPF